MMASPSIFCSTLFIIFLLPTSFAHPRNKGLSFSVPVYQIQRHHPSINTTYSFSPSMAYTYSLTNHENLILMPLYIGTTIDGKPLLSTKLVVDTGSSLVWLQAEPCKHCYNQGLTPFYNSSASTTYGFIHCREWLCGTVPCSKRDCQDERWDAQEPCPYTAMYADSTTSRGTIATETFYFEAITEDPGNWNVSVPSVPFGMGTSNNLPKNFPYRESVPGIAGLTRGYGGLLNRLGVTKFSHCFPREKDVTGILRFGDDSIIEGQKVTLLKNYRTYSALQTNVYLSGKRVNIPDLPTEMNFDTGASTTFLIPEMMDAMVESIKKALGKYRSYRWRGYELCYNIMSLSSVSLDDVAKVTFEFNYSTNIDIFSFQMWDEDLENKKICLGFSRTDSGRNSFGNNLMREMNIAYSLDEDELAMYFNHEHCIR